MGFWQQPLVRLAMIALTAWMLLSLLMKVSPMLVVLAIGLSGLSAVIYWMLRYDRPRLARLYARPGCRQAIDAVCKLTREQPPVSGHAADQPEETLALRQPADFAQATQRLLHSIRGHDDNIQAVMAHLQKNVQLRSRRSNKARTPPLASFLFAGRAGIGKRSLAERLGRLLHKKGATLVLDLGEYDDAAALAALFGVSGGTEGALMGPIKSQPLHTIVLENVDRAAPRVLERLGQLLTSGVCIDETNGAPVSFEHCVFFLTTTACVEALAALRETGVANAEWHAQAQQALAGDTALPTALLGSLHDILYFESPSDVTKAEVIALLMQRECKSHDVVLDQVRPEVLAREVAAVSETEGFALLPARIARLLRAPLLRAAATNRTHINVGRDDLTLYGEAAESLCEQEV